MTNFLISSGVHYAYLGGDNNVCCPYNRGVQRLSTTQGAGTGASKT